MPTEKEFLALIKERDSLKEKVDELDNLLKRSIDGNYKGVDKKIEIFRISCKKQKSPA